MSAPTDRTPDLARKKVRNEKNWKRRLASEKRYAAKKPPSIPTCQHNTKSFKCFYLSIPDVTHFHTKFYKSRNKTDQDAYIIKYSTLKTPKRRRPSQNKRHRNASIHYFIPKHISRELIPVCKNTFLRALNLSHNRVNGVLKRFQETGIMPKENRGGDRVKDKNLDKKKKIRDFIKSFSIIESHYCRGHSSREYLPSDLSINKMWKMFNTKFPEYTVKESFFRTLFNTKFNLGFNAPQTDVCSRCLELKSRIKNTRDLHKKQNLMTESRIHKLKAKAFFDLLKEEKAGMLTMSYDCEKNLVLPKIPDQQAYYKRQFYIYNFTIVLGTSHSSLKKDNVFCCTWKETDKAKGSNEIASAVFDRLQKIELDDITDLRLCSDGCGGQNKNLAMITMACTWLQRAPAHVKSVELVFPVTGHSYIPPDRVFANIEKKIRKKDTIIDPQEYLDIFSESGMVQVLGVDWKVYDWQEQVKKHLRATSSLPFKINSCKRVLITKNTKGNVIVQGEPFYKHLVGNPQGICKKGKTFYDINPDEMDVGHRNMKREKIKNVDELLTGHFGSTWKEEAENLGLQYYRDILCRDNPSNEEEAQEEIVCEPQEDDNRFV